ncbi:CPBP family intramembrane glutamic endopeptidase [Leucobacter sp. M11]|uniref:CPBP family intramembrane glutamic endopeptidase n=1 Tax=Leucobacter sp. M11 TaxID=2993565 RepID=UPI003FA544CB
MSDAPLPTSSPRWPLPQPGPPGVPDPAPLGRGRIRAEIAVVLALSLGMSAVFAVVQLAELLAKDAGLAEQTQTLNASTGSAPLFDLLYQLLRIVFGLAPVALVCFLLWRPERPHLGALGLGRTGDTWRQWLRESAGGIGLAAVIGVPGIGLYLGAKALGLNVTMVAAALNEHWWTVPVLVLAALKAALLEEIIVVGYLFARLRQLGLGRWGIIVSAALFRGSYHLYQGFGGFIGNVAMGLVFGWAYARWGRLLPLVIAHWVLDIVSFVGYAFAVATWPELFAAQN